MGWDIIFNFIENLLLVQSIFKLDKKLKQRQTKSKINQLTLIQMAEWRTSVPPEHLRYVRSRWGSRNRVTR